MPFDRKKALLANAKTIVTKVDRLVCAITDPYAIIPIDYLDASKIIDDIRAVTTILEKLEAME